MNNFKKISAVILALCTAATVLYSCDNSQKTDVTSTTANAVEITEIITEKETVTVEVTNEKGEVSVSVSEKIITVPVTKKMTTVKKDETNKNTVANKITSVINQVTTVVSTQSPLKTSVHNKPVTTAKKPAIKATSVATTKRPVIDDKISEKSVGIFLLSKTDPVQTGNQASIIVQGTPGKTYSIEFYETPTSVAKLTELNDAKADSNGFVTWIFEIRNTCNLGKRKVIIKEKNSNNYIETSITVK